MRTPLLACHPRTFQRLSDAVAGKFTQERGAGIIAANPQNHTGSTVSFGEPPLVTVVDLLGLGGRAAVVRTVGAFAVGPVRPFQGRDLDSASASASR